VLAAAYWLVQQGAQIINFSGSGFVSPLDGSAALDRYIDLSTQAGKSGGTTWIVAAGNQAQLHWAGDIRDNNHNGWVDLGTGASPSPLGDLIALEVGQTGPVSITLNWSPWGRAAADLDAFLYRVDANGKSSLVAQADTPQGSDNPHPVEQIQRTLDAGVYLLGLRASRLTGKGRVHVFVSGAQRMLPVIAAGSVGSPGTARNAITVGALRANDEGIEAYSGLGPTDDGRNKPELFAHWPAPTSGAASFRGTSAATPVVTGAAALLAAKTGNASAANLRQALRAASTPRRDAAGWGDLSAQALATNTRR